MGEANEETRKLILQVLGQEPELKMNPDGTMSLRMGHIIINAEMALWSDPSAYLHGDGMLTVSWGAQMVRIPLGSRQSGALEIQRDLLRGEARWVS